MRRERRRGTLHWAAHPVASSPRPPTPIFDATQPAPRVVHLTTVHHPADPRIALKECGTLRAAGYDVQLVAARPEAAAEVASWMHLTPRVGEGVGRALRQVPALAETVRLRPALVHVHDPELLPLAVLLRTLLRVPVVYDMHEDYLDQHPGKAGRLLRWMEERAAPRLDAVVVVNEALADVARDLGARRVTLVRNHYLPPAEVPPPERAERFRLIYTGVIADERGLVDVLRLARAIQQRGLPWDVVLAGVCYLDADRQRADAFIQQHGLSAADGGPLHRIGWDTYVPWQRLTEEVARSHVGLCLMAPTRKHADTLPTKFFEYLHHGLPLLCSDLPRWQAFVHEHGCGAAVAPGDTQVQLDVLERWWREPDRLGALRTAARVAAPHYHWRTEGERLLALYRDLLA